MIQLSNVDKKYRLGEIGSGTLYRDLQSWIAARKGLPDPNSKIGHENFAPGESFYALKNISLSVKKGERLGIIGGNGAGKSTLLKLISRVTTPSAGEIDLYGRVTSMLEVGTGFHSEMTGRENIYLNGAILGMSKKEIDNVLEQIIDFSEVREFIDTPVKRYSSGMYVKLAFSVAAHLNSEIVIMDEVLAVGDIAFQKKCIQKMQQAALNEGRTILYVSHNMSTIRELCDRCIVLDRGRLVYDGDVEQAVSHYSKTLLDSPDVRIDFSSYSRRNPGLSGICRIEEIIAKEKTVQMGGVLPFSVRFSAREANEIRLRIMAVLPSGHIVGMTYSDPVSLPEGSSEAEFGFDTAFLAADVYSLDIAVSSYEKDVEIRHDFISRALSFSVDESVRYFGKHWESRAWGNVKLPAVKVTEVHIDER